MKKRLLTVLLAVILVMALGTVTAFADEPKELNQENLSTIATANDSTSSTRYWDIPAGNYKLTGNIILDNTIEKAQYISLRFGEGESTLDLNGYSITSNTMAAITNQGTLTINDSGVGGTITGTRGIDNYGTLILNSGTIVGTGSTHGTIRFRSAGSFTMNGGTVTSNQTNAVYIDPECASTITILGGTIGDISMNGGTLTVGSSTVTPSYNIKVGNIKSTSNLAANYTLKLYDGIIESIPSSSKASYDPRDPSALIVRRTTAPGGFHFESTEHNGQTYYQLKENSEPVAHIAGTNYYYLPDAVAALKEGETLVLEADFEVSDMSEVLNFTVPNVTLNLNGHNITSKSAASPVACSGDASGTFTITNFAGTVASITANENQGFAIADVSARSNTSVTVVIEGNVTVDGVLLRSGARIADTTDNRGLLDYDGSMSDLYAVAIDGENYIYGGGNISAIGRDAAASVTAITATLLGDADDGITYGNADVALTVDLDNHVVTSVGNAAVGIPSGAKGTRLTVQNGTVRGGISAAGASSENCTLTLVGLNMTSNGDAGVAANGSKSDGLTLTLTNCTLTSTNNSNMTTGVFFPVGKGVLTIENSTITGYNTGVQAYAGTVTIRGADTEITGSGVSVPNIGDEGNPMATGPIFDGAAVSIIDRNTDYGEFVNISIEGGSFSTETGSGDNGAVHVASEVAGNAGSFEDFKNTNDDGDKIVQVSGGTFTSSVSEYVTDNLKAELYSAADGTYTYYKTTEEASAAAEPGDVVSGVTETAKYIVKVVYGNGAADTSVTVSSNATYILPGELVREGYIFQGWSDGTRTYPAGYSYTVTGNVTFTAVWKADRPVNLPDTHSIDLVVSDGGEAKLSLTNASEGATVTVTVTPDEGYVLDYITVDGERISGTSFTMPDHDVTVRVYFTDGAATLPFTDVASGAWYYDAVAYVYENGLMDGVSDTLFNPDGEMTRAMVWAILARLDGESVTGDDWAESAREWAVSEGVTDGENPDVAVTREMLVTMLWRYAGSPASSYSLDGWSDAADVSDWAADAMAWAIENGIITGAGEDVLDAQGGASRAQCAAILMRYLEG